MEAGAIIAALALLAYLVVEHKRLAEFGRKIAASYKRRFNGLSKGPDERSNSPSGVDYFSGATEPAAQSEDVDDNAHSIVAEWVDGSVEGWSRANWQLDIYARTPGPIRINGVTFHYWPVGARALKRSLGQGAFSPRPIGEGREREGLTAEFPLDWIPGEHRNEQPDAAGLVEIHAEVSYTDEATGRSGTVTAGPG